MLNYSKNKKTTHPVLIVFVILVFVIISAASASKNNDPTSYNNSGSKNTSYSSSYYSGSSGYSYAPSANSRKPAMTKEEAARLEGTGYHGTRPGSSAEMTELKAAMEKCKNCGYHTDNGANSLCDYCQYMERHGGSSSNTAQRSSGASSRSISGSRSSCSTSDPYNASDCSDPDDLYEDYYDDFLDYDEAEEYWDDHN